MSGNCVYQSFTVEWFRGGKLVSQPGKSYTLTSADLGEQISARVTPIGNRFTTVKKELGPVVVRGRLFTLAPVPLISGGNQAGNVLTVDAGAWDSGTSLQYQWLRNGSLISGAVGPTYTIQALDADQSITCRVAASKDAYESTERESLAVRVLAQTFTQTGAPRISGDNVVGGGVMVFRGTWDDGVSFTYQWMRNGQAISGATSLNYVFKPEDAGQSITVQVTGSKVGFSTVTKESRAVIPTSS
jgi:hypothetical protein